MNGDCLPAGCNYCRERVHIPLEDLALEVLEVDRVQLNELVAWCPNGHATFTLVRETLAYQLRQMGVRSIAEEAQLFLADRRTDIL